MDASQPDVGTQTLLPSNVSGSLQGVLHVYLGTNYFSLSLHNIFCLWMTTDNITKGTTVCSLISQSTTR